MNDVTMNLLVFTNIVYTSKDPELFFFFNNHHMYNTTEFNKHNLIRFPRDERKILTKKIKPQIP